jgi:hypothetical protein
MWHNIKQIAKTHRFDDAAFINFAKANVDKLSLIEEGDSLLVNTWNADSLIDGFKAQQHNLDKPMETTPSTVAEQFLQEKDLRALKRFYETTEDGEGYDIGKDAVQRLAELGCLQRVGTTTRYGLTSFGLYVIGYFDYELPLKTERDYPRINPHPDRIGT